MKLNSNILTGALAISFAAILWGFDGIVLTPRLYNLSISYVVFMVHCIPFVILNLFCYKSYKELRTFTGIDLMYFFLIALFGGALGTLAMVKALFLVNFQSLTVVVLLQKLQPVFAILLASVLLKEKVHKGFVVWASVAIVASYFLAFGLHLPDFNTGSRTALAALFSLMAAFSFGSATVFGKKIINKVDFISVTFFRYGFTTVIMLLIMIMAGTYTQFHTTTAQNWAILVLIGFTTGSGALFLFYYGLRKVKAMVATICELLFPLSAILFDYLFNGKVLTPVQWISAIILLIAIIKLSIRPSVD
ncbi:MAG: DMT family transporter [Bacteroidota bacterium]|nr:DMT family transporter [Bacteroidota bacterium]MDP4289777.1 DMT family transporter [Bacteroidota bacterium]